MKTNIPTIPNILRGYDEVCKLYPFVPSLCIWRSWEYAVYRKYSLSEPVLDVGCGDGRFLRLIWPRLQEVVGVDIDEKILREASRLGIYKALYQVPAHRLDEIPLDFAAAFANCSLEHMDQLDKVLESIRGRLQPGGVFLLSVVTDKFLEWNPLPTLFEIAGEEKLGASLLGDYRKYHHLVNAFPSSRWARSLSEGGFEILEHTPLLPELTSRLFSFADHLWHIREKESELGNRIGSYLAQFPDFSEGFRLLLEGILKMEKDWTLGSGAVFWARRSR